jgi:hypothetical protein
MTPDNSGNLLDNPIQKKKICMLIRKDVLIKLKVLAAQKSLPYSIVIEALADSYCEDPVSFPPINFDKYR